MKGVVRTRVGYAGGSTKNPTYARIGDHTESIQIDYDPEATSYAALLKVFWKSHSPCSLPFSRQYMSAIFVHSDDQRKAAEETLKLEEKTRGRKIHTRILDAGTFTLAEDYHQKYYLRQTGLDREFAAVYPNLEDFVNSTAVTRLNAYVGGHGTREELEKEIDRLGLSAAGREKLLRLVR